MAPVSGEIVRELEGEAYMAVLKAFMAGPADWEKDEQLSQLRKLLNITNEIHLDVLQQVKADLLAIKETGARPRPKASRPGLLPSPSLDGPGSAGRRGPGRPLGSGMPRPSGAPRARQAGRPRMPRAGDGADPFGYVGRRVWRLWPNEDPPWVEGFITSYNPINNAHSILYDPNAGSKETVEEFAFSAASPDEYVIDDYADFMLCAGSRRQRDRPHVPLHVVAQGPPPSKKRKGSAPPVPHRAPFEGGYFSQRLALAEEEELQQMLAVLQRSEGDVEREAAAVEGQLESGADLEHRSELRRQLEDLCSQEERLMDELRSMRESEA